MPNRALRMDVRQYTAGGSDGTNPAQILENSTRGSRDPDPRTRPDAKSTTVICDVVIEERDSRMSSIRQSKRRSSRVNATCTGHDQSILTITGEAGTETYRFRKADCKLFRAFTHE
ncbi:unnamed protein product, partial [Discosporangium mesarthrocarpum]